MSVEGDLSQALQDGVAPNRKAVIAGLNALRDEVRSGNALIREEIGLIRDDLRLQPVLFAYQDGCGGEPDDRALEQGARRYQNSRLNQEECGTRKRA